MPDYVGATLRVAVCICTCKRPTMLQASLASLACQLVTPDLRPLIIVIDNEAEPNNASIAHEAEKTSPYEIAYWHEPRRGIAIARNAALHLALEFGAQWIAFIDDDEIAEPDWLANLMAPEYLHISVVAGLRQYLFPEDTPRWLLPKKQRRLVEGSELTTVSTSNVRFSIQLARAGLRFDESLKLAGGEGQRFFWQVNKLGFRAFAIWQGAQ
jgi:succinoglycan biosynthesis protein ExoM